MKYYFVFLFIFFLSCQNREELAFEAFAAENYQEALKQFTEISTLDPHNWYHLFNIARCLEELGRCDEAISWYGKSLKYNSDAEEILLARGRCLLKTEYLPGAYTDILRVLEKDPENFEANYLMGKIAMADNDPWVALNYLNKAIQINDSEVNLFYHRGIIMGSMGNTYGALRDINYVLSKKANFNQAYYNRGILLMRSKQYEAAVRDFDTSEELQYAPAELFIRRGDSKTLLGDKTEACIDYKKAAQLDKAYERVVREECSGVK